MIIIINFIITYNAMYACHCQANLLSIVCELITPVLQMNPLAFVRIY